MILRSKRLWIVAMLGIAAIAAGITALTLLRDAPEDAAWEHVQETGILRVGMDAAYPPFEYVDVNNQIVGFDVDLAREIGQRLGVEMEFVNMAYDGLYDALLIGQVDVLISALVAAPEFQGKASFSVPYFNMGEYLVVRSDSSLATIEDMAGHTLAVEIGSGGDVEARKWERRLSGLTVSRYPDPGAALNSVLAGEADAALVDGVTARMGVGQYEELALGSNIVETLIAAAVHPDSTTLHARVDEAISGMLADGTVDALIDQWFGQQRGE